ncbi:PREDICTED: programmed cell death protein 1 [Elephantulus edwardii]|uniref:programmed cell death protein 1 n=1 Tax=Elephantulus edwardii TaxID=28737 RepID=UPI0003F0C0E5|nr:PREDICTED: programmed cell death protein 1 [Elephantulus edwardii]
MRAPWAPWPLIWTVLQLGWQLGQLQGCSERPGTSLTFQPPQLIVPEGGEAEFFCSFPNATKPSVLNWYRGSPSNRSVKMAAFPKDLGPPTQDPRFNITPLADQMAFRLHISPVQRNDSDTYYCGAINLPPETQITESPCAELIVTDSIWKPSITPSSEPMTQGHFQTLVISVTSILAGILVLLLLAWGLATILPRTTQVPRDSPSRNNNPTLGLLQSQKEDPSTMPVFTVDYGELDFQQREKTPEPPTPCFPPQTEYATIIFPDCAPPGGRRGSADGPWGPRSPRPEDAHCSWPL